jgi:hypothetical protein
MSRIAKQRISGIACVFGAFFMVFCISRMIPYGLAGESHKAQMYFLLMIVAFAFCLTFGLAYYYYRSNANGDNELERMRIEVDALSHLAQKSMKAKSEAYGTNHSNDPRRTERK